MLNKVSDRALAALATLKGNTDFEAVMEWLQVEAQDVINTLLTAKDEVMVRQLQGAGQTLVDLIQTAENARERLGKRR